MIPGRASESAEDVTQKLHNTKLLDGETDGASLSSDKKPIPISAGK